MAGDVVLGPDGFKAELFRFPGNGLVEGKSKTAAVTHEQAECSLVIHPVYPEICPIIFIATRKNGEPASGDRFEICPLWQHKRGHGSSCITEYPAVFCKYIIVKQDLWLQDCPVPVNG